MKALVWVFTGFALGLTLGLIIWHETGKRAGWLTLP